MSWSDNRGTFNTDSFRFVCETAIETMGPQLAKHVFKEAMAESRRVERLRQTPDVLWNRRTGRLVA